MSKYPESQKTEATQEHIDRLLQTLMVLEPEVYKLASWSAEFNNEPFPKALRRLVIARDRNLLNKIYGRNSLKITGLTPQDKQILNTD